MPFGDEKHKLIFEALEKYLDERFVYEFDCREVDEEGYTTSHPKARKRMEKAREELIELLEE